MAEGIATKWLKEHDKNDWLAVSAGIFAVDGMRTSEETVQALDLLGIGFEGTSNCLTEKMAKEAKKIYCMSSNHLRAISEWTDNAELLDPENEIVDPIGQDQLVYDALARKMELLISSHLKKLVI